MKSPSGVCYCRLGYYNPSTGRFINRAPITEYGFTLIVCAGLNPNPQSVSWAMKSVSFLFGGESGQASGIPSGVMHTRV